MPLYYNDPLLSDDEKQLLKESFTSGGSCGCDGYYDSGCPACSDEKRAEWLVLIREPKNIWD
jgi:hypothetical protein